MLDRNRLYDQIAGCLMAGALGDAMGYEIEFMPWKKIQKKYGEDGLKELVTHDGWALISDDTQMTLFTNEAMVLGRQYERLQCQIEGETSPTYKNNLAYYLYHGYLCWLKTQVYPIEKIPNSIWKEQSELLKIPEMNKLRAPGNTCLSALKSGKMGTIENPVNNSKGCGGVMRSAPVGFMTCWGNPLLNGAESAAITHGHPGGWIPAGILSDVVYRIIYDSHTSLLDVIYKSIEAAKVKWKGSEADEVYSTIEAAIILSQSEIYPIDAIDSIGGGWVGDEALAVAIYSCLKYPGDIKEALICAVNHSGDSDSTGAIAGNILGAYHGLKALPEDWISKLELTDQICRQAENVVNEQQ